MQQFLHIYPKGRLRPKFSSSSTLHHIKPSLISREHVLVNKQRQNRILEWCIRIVKLGSRPVPQNLSNSNSNLKFRRSGPEMILKLQHTTHPPPFAILLDTSFTNTLFYTRFRHFSLLRHSSTLSKQSNLLKLYFYYVLVTCYLSFVIANSQ